QHGGAARLLEIVQHRGGDMARDRRTERARPTLAHEECARPQLSDRPRQRERLERACARVVVEVDGAHVCSRMLRGNVSISCLRSEARSVVVTRVRPGRETTTRSRTPYSTTA